MDMSKVSRSDVDDVPGTVRMLSKLSLIRVSISFRLFALCRFL